MVFTIAIIVWGSSINNTSNTILVKTDLICINKANQPNVYLLLGKVIEGGDIEAYLFEKSMDYPRDPKTGQLTAAIHPQLQVLKITFISKQTRCNKYAIAVLADQIGMLLLLLIDHTLSVAHLNTFLLSENIPQAIVPEFGIQIITLYIFPSELE